MPFTLDGNKGETVIESRGSRNRISFKADPVRQEPKIDCKREVSLVKKGTRTTVTWPDSACSILEGARARFLQIAQDFAWLNPHLTLSVS